MMLARAEAEQLAGGVTKQPYYGGRWRAVGGHGGDLGWSGIEANTEEKTVTVVL